MKLLPLLLALLMIGSICMGEDNKDLITLEEHEQSFWENYGPITTSSPCGIKCPKCGAELQANYSISLTSNPPQTPVYCPKCKWSGSIH